MILIIAEKPSLAGEIQKALIPNATKQGGSSFGHFESKDSDIIISWCFGHLFNELMPNQIKNEWSWKTVDVTSLPFFIPEIPYQVKPEVKGQHAHLKKLMKQSTEIVNACDPDREGESIFRKLYEGDLTPASRMWFSDLQTSTLADSFKNRKPLSHYDNLAMAAQCRSLADWHIGMNFTMSYTIKSNKKYLLGRVKTPTLNMVVSRYLENTTHESATKHKIVANINNFKDIKLETKDEPYETESACQGLIDEYKQSYQSNGNYTVAVKKKNSSAKPPKLFDLGSLQKECYSKFKFSAANSLDYLQKLYEQKLVSYPRTESRYLTEEMKSDVEQIYLSHNHGGNVGKVEDSIFNDKKVGSHYAIIPTNNVAKLTDEKLTKVYGLILERFNQQFQGNHEYDSFDVRITLKDVDPKFWVQTKLNVTTTAGWSNVDQDKQNQNLEFLAVLRKGLQLDESAVTFKLEDYKTKPKPLFNPSSLITAMEQSSADDISKEDKAILKEVSGIGTPATRAGIIDQLVKDGYMKLEKKGFVPSELGLDLIQNLPVNSNIHHVLVTAEIEQFLKQIDQGQKSKQEFDIFLKQYMQVNIDAFNTIVSKPKYEMELLEETCPDCGKQLAVKEGKYGKYIGCSDYPNCKYIKKEKKEVKLSEEKCPDCGSQLAIRNGKNGEFLSCSNFPKCKYVKSDKKPAKKSDKKCPKCKKALLIREGKNGEFLACSGYPKCKHIENI